MIDASSVNTLQPSVSTGTCNGIASNCLQRVNELMFATLHNAMSSEEDGFDSPSHSLRLEVSALSAYINTCARVCMLIDSTISTAGSVGERISGTHVGIL